jgi:hypothetical protein
VTGTALPIDLSSVKSKMDAFDARKRELAEAFLQASDAANGELADEHRNGGHESLDESA